MFQRKLYVPVYTSFVIFANDEKKSVTVNYTDAFLANLHCVPHNLKPVNCITW